MGNLALSSVFTPIGIAHFYFAGVPSEQAWNCLVQAHQNSPVFFPLLDLATVKYWYTLFQTGYLNQFFIPPAPGIAPMLQLPLTAPVQIQSPVMWQMPGQALPYVQPSPNLAPWMPSLYSPNAQPQAPVPEPAPEYIQIPQSPILAPMRVQSPFMWQLPVQAPDYMAARTPMPRTPEAYLPAQMFDPALFPVAAPVEPERPPIPLLHELPVYHKIIDELNGHDQRSLRRVCREFNEYVRNQDRLYRKIQISVRGNSILLHVKSGSMKSESKFIYRRTDDGCTIRTNGQSTPSKKSPLEECLMKLKEYVQKMNTKIEKFVVSQTARVEIKPLLQKIALIMGKLRFKLTIEKLEVDTSDFVGFEAVMEEIQPGSLIDLRINNLDAEREELNLSNMTSLMAHLHHLEDFFVPNVRIDFPIEALAHIRSVVVRLLPPTPAQVLIYRERLLQFESIVIHSLNFPDGFDLQMGEDVELDEENDSFQEIEQIPMPNKRAYILVEKRNSNYRLVKRRA